MTLDVNDASNSLPIGGLRILASQFTRGSLRFDARQWVHMHQERGPHEERIDGSEPAISAARNSLGCGLKFRFVT